jgi:hypothetical protein
MRIVIQEKKVDKHTGEVTAEEVALDNSGFDGYRIIRLTIGDTYVELPVSNLFTAAEAFHRYKVRDDKEQVRAQEISRD